VGEGNSGAPTNVNCIVHFVQLMQVQSQMYNTGTACAWHRIRNRTGAGPTAPIRKGLPLTGILISPS
jgi:hypothetical protein